MAVITRVGAPCFFERVLQAQGVNDGGQHPHVVGGNAIHVLRGCRDAAKEIAAAHHQSDLHAGLRDFGDLRGQSFHALRIDAKGGPTGQNLTAQLQKDPIVLAAHGASTRAARCLGTGCFG